MTAVVKRVAPARVAAEPLRPACVSGVKAAGASAGTIRRIADGANSGCGTSPRLLPGGAGDGGAAGAAAVVGAVSGTARTVVTWPAASAEAAVSGTRVAVPGARTTQTVAPIRTSSPSLRRRGWSIRSPFTKVPFVEP